MQFFSPPPSILPRKKLSAFTISQIEGGRQSLPYGKTLEEDLFGRAGENAQ